MTCRTLKLSGVFIFLLLVSLTSCRMKKDLLAEQFMDPPDSCKPRTWMHAMSGNMSEAGLTMDLESIAEAGIGGVLLFNVSQGIPNGRVTYNSEEHHRMIRHAAGECERLGLSFGVHNCDGWSSSGGPWIEPEQSMKMVAWTETLVRGGDSVRVKLDQPTTREGYYRDIAVLAYPSLASDLADFSNMPEITCSDPDFDTGVSADYRIDGESTIRSIDSGEPWIQYAYGEPQTIRSVHMVFTDRAGLAVLQSSDDGIQFRTVVEDLCKVRSGKGEWNIVDHFDGVTARYFRLKFNQGMTIREARLSSVYSIQNFLGRTGLARTDDARLKPIGEPLPDMIIPLDSIRDLSGQVDETGTLRTMLPPGAWTVLRFGYTSTGAFNHPASDEGRGLECDKFSREAFRIHYDAFTERVIREAAEIAPHAMQYVEIDSYEMGGQNWTEGFETLFRDQKSYDIRSFLPLFAGKFVESARVSEAVMWDLREVFSNLMVENYFGYFTELCHRDGVQSYIEPYGNGPFNDLDAGGRADMVMGEFWMNRPMTQVASAISSGHIYGKEIISAESFTSTHEINWKGHPAMAKPSGDRAWAAGINEFMFHRFVHQANTRVEPGLTMNRWGFHFDRTQTWWKNAGPGWFRYIARGSFLLRQGYPVSDLLIFVGDGSPNSTYVPADFDPQIPTGIKYDFVNREVLLNRIRIEDRQLVLPEGTRYPVLVLQNCERLSPETMERIHEIAAAGVALVGLDSIEPAGYLPGKELRGGFKDILLAMNALPNCYPGYPWQDVFGDLQLEPDFIIRGREDVDFMHRKIGRDDFYFIFNPDPQERLFECRFRVDEKIPELWDPMNGRITRLGHFSHSDGICTVHIPLEAHGSAFIAFRDAAGGIPSVKEIRTDSPGVKVELNEKDELVVRSSRNGFIDIVLNSGEQMNLLIEDLPSPVGLGGPWEVEFKDGQGHQSFHRFSELTDWRLHPEPEVSFFSGTAIYRQHFDFHPLGVEQGLEYYLELGDVAIVAGVRLNGRDLGVSWMKPHRLEITGALLEGKNHLEIALTNQWTNRLIGDERFPHQGRKIQLEGNFPKGRMPEWYMNNEPLPDGPGTTFCSGNFYRAGDELIPSGLLGPVFISAEKTVPCP